MGWHMIKSILFDFDGVLTLDATGSQSICNYVCKETGVDKDLFKKEYKKYNNDLLYGKTKHEDIWEKVFSGINKEISVEILYDSFINTRIDNEMCNLIKDIKSRINTRGGTKFTPVFEYANKHKVNLLIYFTDGKGEEKLLTIPKGYKTLWVISGRGDKLSLKEAYGPVKKLKNIVIKEDTLEMSDLKIAGYSMNDQEKMHI
jgi:hypothetical protein